jgi:YYY domain-containing protein
MTTAGEIFLAARWYLVLQLFGLAALPLALRLFRHLPGRGYAFARPLGLLVSGWLLWLLSIFGWLPNTAGAVVVALALVVTAGVVLWLRVPPGSGSLSWRHVLLVELILLVAFVSWALVRARMPNIETAGGEKWMEIAFLNAILRAPRFPPHDPWLSGFAISYYYFGYVIMSMLVRLSGAPATIGFNLGIATLFALTCTGAYGLLYGLLGDVGKRWAAAWSLLGPLFVALVGNLGGLLEVFRARGLFPDAFWRWLDIPGLRDPLPELAERSWVPGRWRWWWQASRVILDYAPTHTPAAPAEWELIDEFPAFSFLLGDMHPHVLGLPFVLLVLALALALFYHIRSARSTETGEENAGTPLFHLHLFSPDLSLPLSRGELFFYALCLGGLGFLNTWDLPIYLFVMGGTFLVATVLHSAGPDARPVMHRLRAALPSFLTFVLLITIGGFVLYLPFWIGLRSQASGVAPNLFNNTRLRQFLVMFAPLLFPIVVLVVVEAWRRRIRFLHVARWTGALLLGLLFLLFLAMLIVPQGRQYLTAWLSGEPIPGVEGVENARSLIASRIVLRFLTPWTALGLALLTVTTILVLLHPRQPSTGRKSRAKDSPSRSQIVDPVPGLSFVLLLILTGTLLTLAVEFVFLRDIFGTRINTVFKFYFQTWILWSVAAAYVLARMAARGRTWAVAIGLLLAGAGLVYITLAVPARAREHVGRPTLDGAAHLRRFEPNDRARAADQAAIEWLNERVDGVEVILEAPGRGYQYEGRVSAFTGLPAVLGWSTHELQWRGDYVEQGIREPDIETLYTTTDPAQTLTLLDRYGIRYVYVGPVERGRYPPQGLAKFAQLLDVVYDTGDVTIYHYTPAELEEQPGGSEPFSRAPGLGD